MAQKKQMSFRFDPRMFDCMQRDLVYLGLDSGSVNKTDLIECFIDVIDDLVFSSNDQQLSWIRYRFYRHGFNKLEETSDVTYSTTAPRWTLAEAIECLDKVMFI